MGYRVKIADEETFARDMVRVLVVDEGRLVDHGSFPVPDFAFEVPRGAVEPLRQAILDWQGKSSDEATEIRVLREWLAAEMALVERLLSATSPERA